MGSLENYSSLNAECKLQDHKAMILEGKSARHRTVLSRLSGVRSTSVLVIAGAVRRRCRNLITSFYFSCISSLSDRALFKQLGV